MNEGAVTENGERRELYNRILVPTVQGRAKGVQETCQG